MKKMKLVFSFLEKAYWLGFGLTLLAAVFTFGVITSAWYFLAKQEGIEGGFLEAIHEYAVKHNDPLGQFLFSSSGFSYSLLVTAAVLALAFLHAKTFTKLHQFIKARLNNLSLAEQRKILWPIPTYVVVAYILDFALEADGLRETTSPFTEGQVPTWAAKMPMEMLDALLPKLFPSLGSPLGLIFALLIYFYCQSLQQSESLSQEAQKLREEAELVI